MNRTRLAVMRQIKAMGADRFDVGVRNTQRGMLNKEWSAAELGAAVGWLQAQNTNGSDIYCRPARREISSLVLVDDLTLAELSRLRAGPLTPAVITETSPANFQAWIELGEPVSADVRKEIARDLAREYDADPNSADAFHYGRLAGFTNRKPSRVDEAGRAPFVLLTSYRGKPAPGAEGLIRAATERLAASREQGEKIGAMVRDAARSMPVGGLAYSVGIGHWYKELYSSLRTHFGPDFDSSRADWMAAVAMYRRGYAYEAVVDALKLHSPGISSRKRRNAELYICSTAGKAEVWVELERQGRTFDEVRDTLLDLAIERANARQAAANQESDREIL